MNGSAELTRSLKLWHIVVIGLGYMAPMAVLIRLASLPKKQGGMFLPLTQ